MIKINWKEWKKTQISLGAIVALVVAIWTFYPDAKAVVGELHADNIENVIQPEIQQLAELAEWAKRTDEEVAEQKLFDQVDRTEDSLRWVRAEQRELRRAQRDGDDSPWIQERLDEIEVEIEHLERHYEKLCAGRDDC